MTLKSTLKAKNLDFNLASQEEICQELGRRIKVQRLIKNIKQDDLAGRAGVSVGTIKNLESKGHSSLETLVRIAIALDLRQSLASLFEVKIQSIAQMELLERLTTENIRRRAR